MAPPSTADAMRAMVDEIRTAAATGAKVDAMVAQQQAHFAKIDRHLADSDRDRADFEAALAECRALGARLEADLRRMADAAAGAAAAEKARTEAVVRESTTKEAAWKEQGAALKFQGERWLALTGVVLLLLERVVTWLAK